LVRLFELFKFNWRWLMALDVFFSSSRIVSSWSLEEKTFVFRSFKNWYMFFKSLKKNLNIKGVKNYKLIDLIKKRTAPYLYLCLTEDRYLSEAWRVIEKTKKVCLFANYKKKFFEEKRGSALGKKLPYQFTLSTAWWIYW